MVVPATRIVPRQDAATLSLDGFDWVLWTSATTVAVLSTALTAVPPGPSPGHRQRHAAIGEATARALRDRGVTVEVVAQDRRAEGLLDALWRAGLHSGQQVLLVRARQGRQLLPAALRAAGVDVQVRDVYDILPASPSALAGPLYACEASKVHWVVLTSGTSVDAIVAAVYALGKTPQALFRQVHLAALGPVVADHARRCGLSIVLTAPEADATALTRSIADRHRSPK
jgi:uroporphyrinogen-III synthase